MTSNRRNIALVVVALVFASLLLAPVAAQPEGTTTAAPSNNTTTTTTATTTTGPSDDDEVQQRIEQVRSGPYDLSELTKTGTMAANTDQKSLRVLGDPPMGFVKLRYRSPTIIDEIQGNPGQWKDIHSSNLVEQNAIQVYGSAFGDVAGEYTLEVVFWQRDTVMVDNTSVPYASNQTIDTYTVDMSGDTLYTQQNATLRAHFDDTWQGTAFLKDSGGDTVARWTFTHRSNPSSAAINIDSAGGAWAFTIKNAVIPGGVSVIVGLVLSYTTIQKIGRGPGYGVSTWLFVVGIVSVIISLIAYYQIAVILTNIPSVMGFSMFFIAYAAGLTFHPDQRIIGFLRRELVDAQTISGDRERLVEAMSDGAGIPFGDDGGAEIWDELTEALYVDLPEIPVVQTDGGYRVPVRGFKAAVARLFADAALLDLSGIATREKVKEGRLSDIIIVDPDSDRALEHKPARIVRTLPIDTLPEDHTSGELFSAYLFTALILIAPGAGGMYLFQMVNLPVVGLLLGAAVSVVLAHSAEDGWIDFEAAPPHYKKAEDNLTILQRAYKTAKEDQSGREQAREERAKTAVEARQEGQADRKTVTDRMLEALGTEASSSLDFDFDYDDVDVDEPHDGDDERGDGK